MITSQKESKRFTMITTNKIPASIIFFGPDGSGKTTQADLLVGALEKSGVKTRKLWLRSLHTLAFMISRVAMRVLNLENIYEFRAKYSHKKFFQGIWYVIEFISILPIIVFKFRLPLTQGYTIVAERYVIDWIASLSYASRNDSMPDSFLAKAVLSFIPKNSLLIYVDASFEAICSRGRTEDSFEYIEFQRRFYQNMAKTLNCVIIDTSDKTVQEVHELISSYALGTRR